MRLTSRERDILLCGQLQADAPIQRIARQTGYREHTVRYALEKFRREEVLHRYPFINIFPLGYEEYGLFFALAAGRADRADLINTLQRDRQVSWIIEVSGEFNLGVAVCARKSAQVGAWLETLAHSFEKMIVVKSIAIRRCWSLFPRRYLSRRRFPHAALSCGDTGIDVVLDERDKSILTALSDSPYSSIREIALKIAVPITTVQNRLKVLKEKKVLVGFAYEINPEKIGFMGYRLLIHAKALRKTLRERLYKYCSAHPHIFAIIECVGTWDYELKIEVESDAELHDLLGDLYEKFSTDILEIKTLRVFSTPKLSFYPFVRQAAA